MKEKILVLMQKYNKLCKRYEKAVAWDNDESISLEAKHAQTFNLKKLIDEMVATSSAIEFEGHYMAASEYLNGFEQVEEFESLGGIIK